MAIEKEKLKPLLDDIEKLTKEIIPNKELRAYVLRMLLGHAFEELKQLVEESRPPVFYLVGRSGHGKSSLINALAGKEVAEVGFVKPTTPQAMVYDVEFPERKASWKVIDSRGIFETSRPEGASELEATDQVIKDIEKYKPDIIFHVINAKEVRNLAKDVEELEKIMKQYKMKHSVQIPVVIVLTHVDILGIPTKWPPEKHPDKAEQIVEVMDYLLETVIKKFCNNALKEPIDPNNELIGYKIKGCNNFVSIIPVCSLKNDSKDGFWNIETLREFIADELPKSAQLLYFQSLKLKHCLRKLAEDIVKRFSLTATAIGTIPIPVSDIMVLTPLQILMIIIVGALSCKPLSRETAFEFMTASGINVGAGFAFRTVAQQLLKLVPFIGPVVSGSIAGAGTYAIGKAAIAYFFYNKKVDPKQFYDEWKSIEGKEKS